MPSFDPNELRRRFDALVAPASVGHRRIEEKSDENGLDGFERDPDLIFDQAREIVLYSLEDTFFLVFERPLQVLAPGNSGEMCEGSQIVLYECDAAGSVFDWSRRYTVEAVSLTAAWIKFRFQRANGRLYLDNHDDL